MNTLQYRVYLFDPTVPRPERPVQAFFTHKARAEDWARAGLSGAGEGSEVWLYQILEVLEGTYKKIKETPKDDVCKDNTK
jgi:hypothetical protein